MSLISRQTLYPRVAWSFSNTVAKPLAVLAAESVGLRGVREDGLQMAS
jgi:hypothetical protein